MILPEHIQMLSPVLRRLLDAELARGNEVVETAMGYPAADTILVFLKNPFVGCYDSPDLHYRELNDRHYWKAEYQDPASGQILACKFG